MSANYSITHYQAIDKVSSGHFWFQARSAMLRALVAKFMPPKNRQMFLEVGCGTGVVLRDMASAGFAVTGLDVNQTALNYARVACPAAHFVRRSLFTYKSPHRFGAVGAFDVLEHQAKDALFLKRCHELLEDGGMLFLTVPAGRWLWSSLDALSGHKRRYEKEELLKKLKQAGFESVFFNYWNMVTIPWYVLYRNYASRLPRMSQRDVYLRMPHAWINRILRCMLWLEQALFLSVPFPFGATIVVCARKTSV